MSLAKREGKQVMVRQESDLVYEGTSHSQSSGYPGKAMIDGWLVMCHMWRISPWMGASMV